MTTILFFLNSAFILFVLIDFILALACEDLDIASCDKIKLPNFIYLLPLSDEESVLYSRKVKQFKNNLCDDVSSRLSSSTNNLITHQSSSILEWANKHNVERVITLATPSGYINDHLMNIKNDLQTNSIELIKVFREYDMKYWNYASKGFFNFFQKAIKNI